jgi:voltage-gated potassium channel
MIVRSQNLIETFKRKVYTIVDISKGRTADPLSWYFDVFITILIIMNVGAVMLSTVTWIDARYRTFLSIFEYFSVIVFTFEYIARVWTCDLSEDYQGAFRGRFLFIFSLFPLIDLIAILPSYYQLFFPAVTAIQTRHFRMFRLFRFIRVLKLGRYSSSLRTLNKVLVAKKEELFIAIFMVGILLVFASTFIYFFEHEDQPDKFSSIPASMWWGVATLTTVGYGDVYPVTSMGRFFAAIIAILGIGVFALPAGILASGFADIMEEKRQLKKSSFCPHCGMDTRVFAETTQGVDQSVDEGTFTEEEANGQGKEAREEGSGKAGEEDPTVS